jgi:pimeloyl-ACP methyl ester carboxylesterase
MLLVHTVNAAASAQEVRPVFEYHRTRRAVYALDLPGYGCSDRSERPYSVRLMTDAVLMLTREIQRRHPGARIDALASSLGTEFLARAAVEASEAFGTLALVSPTGFNGRRRHYGPSGGSREVGAAKSLLQGRPWSATLFRWLTQPRVVRYFLERTYGGKDVDQGLYEAAVRTARVPGAHFAPLAFLSGTLFSADANAIYERLELPVWMSHGVRGDFVDFRGQATVASKRNWTFSVFATGALPYFEQPQEFEAAYEQFLAAPPAAAQRTSA